MYSNTSINNVKNVDAYLDAPAGKQLSSTVLHMCTVTTIDSDTGTILKSIDPV